MNARTSSTPVECSDAGYLVGNRDHEYGRKYAFQCSGNGYAPGMSHETIITNTRECPLCKVLIQLFGLKQS